MINNYETFFQGVKIEEDLLHKIQLSGKITVIKGYVPTFRHSFIILIDKFERRGAIVSYTVVYNKYIFRLTMLNLNFIRPKSFKKLGEGIYGVVFVTKIDRELYAKKFIKFRIYCKKEG
jgi:hypothetical protein